MSSVLVSVIDSAVCLLRALLVVGFRVVLNPLDFILLNRFCFCLSLYCRYISAPIDI